MYMQEDLIHCFSFVYGERKASKIKDKLNKLKSDKSLDFSIAEELGDLWFILGCVTQEDWVGLDLENKSFYRGLIEI